MRWNLVSLIDYFFQIHELLLSINFTNLISKIFSIIIDLIMMNEFEIIEGKLENTFFRVSTIEEHLQINVSPKLESALIKGSPNSPKYSLFFKRSESPQNSLMKINSNSALTRPNFNKNPKKKVRNLLAQLKYSMIPLLLLVQYRENYLDDDLEKKRHYEDSEKFQIFKDKTNSFYNQKKNSIIKKRDFVNKKKEEKEEGKDDYDIKNSKNLLSYCKKIITKWKKIAKMQEIKKEINVIREVLEKLENDMIVCNICRKMIPSKLFKDHSKLCNENDEMREELTRLLTSLKNEDFHWLDHTLRKVKNMIPNLKQQIAKLNENIEDPEIYVNQTIKPSLTRKPLISCPLFNPNFGPMIRKSVNPSQNIIIGYRDTVDVKNVKQSVKKFKALKKNRELKEMMKLKEMLEVGKEWQKTLFRINENIRHYRSKNIFKSINYCVFNINNIIS